MGTKMSRVDDVILPSSLWRHIQRRGAHGRTARVDDLARLESRAGGGDLGLGGAEGDETVARRGAADLDDPAIVADAIPGADVVGADRQEMRDGDRVARVDHGVDRGKCPRLLDAREQGFYGTHVFVGIDPELHEGLAVGQHLLVLLDLAREQGKGRRDALREERGDCAFRRISRRVDIPRDDDADDEIGDLRENLVLYPENHAALLECWVPDRTAPGSPDFR